MKQHFYRLVGLAAWLVVVLCLWPVVVSAQTAEEVREQLQARGHAEEILDDRGALGAVVEEIEAEVAEHQLWMDTAADRIDEQRQVAGVLRRQLEAEGLPDTARDFIAADLLAEEVEKARATAEQAARAAVIDDAEVEIELLRDRLAYLDARDSETLEEDATSRARLAEAEQARQEALRRVTLTLQREGEVLDQELRDLLSQERALAEEIAEVALREEEQLRALDTERRERAEHFAENRARINAKIADFPPHPRQETIEEEIDPLFREVVETRRSARHQLRDQIEELLDAQEQVAGLTAELSRAETQLERHLAGDHQDSEIVQRRLAIAELRVSLAERQLEMARDVQTAQFRKNRLLRERVRFYHDSVETLLPMVSSSQRRGFYSLRSDENWQDAWDAVRHAAEQSQATLEERAELARTLPERILSVPLWLWIFGLLWRCLLFPLAFFFGRDFSSQAVRRMTDYLLDRRFFRRRAAVTVKGGEILQALVEPALLFVATIVVVDYIAQAWGEFNLVLWLINAFFIYWMVMTAIKVLVLPRGYRQERRRRRGEEEKRRFDQFDDIINLEESRAQKIVLSTRVVLLFWLLAYYVPELVVFATGHNVLWRVVDQLATWGLLAVVYVVLSTWRQDIAKVFERLAHDRMPRATVIVREHQNRPWGVLLISLASVYVAGREMARLGRSYLVGTEWNRKISNFFFRKKIELQRRDRETDHEPATNVPEEYRAFFHPQPLIDEPYLVERRELIDRIDGDLAAWHARPCKGAIALVSEQGMGRTTLFNQVFQRWLGRDDLDVAYLQLAGKAAERPDVIEVLASLFGILDPPRDASEFADTLLSLPPKTVIIDDCHHFFLRQIGGFEAMELFLKLVSVTDHHHFWLLSFNRHTWAYLNRVRYRGHFFADVIEMEPWTEEEIQELIRNRNALTDRGISFTELVVATDEDEDDDHHYEIVRTSNGYFRLLHEFSQGNPSVALTFWLRSLTVDSDQTLQVGLFPRPSLTTLKSLSHDYLFALASIAQHGSLTSVEVARTIHAYEGDCELIVGYLDDSDIVEIDPIFQRARIRPLFLRSVTRTLRNANVLYG